VAQGIPAALRRPGEPVPVHGPLVELLLHPGVDGEAGDGITVVNVQQPLELLRLLHPQPGLDGHRQLHGGEYLVKEPLQLLRLCQKARTLALGGDGARGTAQVQIHLRIAHVCHDLRRPQKVRCPAGHHLGHHRKPCVGRRVQLPLIPLGQDMLIRRGEKRDEIPVR
ncbi:Tripartite tricarboxylate transporter TctB family, partial [Dysosmobacter welbionis]